jgi:hypothetical protein
VLSQSEDGRPVVVLVCPETFEDSSAVVEGVGEYVDFGLGPRDQLTIHPNALGRLHLPASERVNGEVSDYVPPTISGRLSQAPGAISWHE